MTELDRLVVAHGGRFYLAKDARLPAEVLGKTDPRVAAFVAMRRERGLTEAFTSEQAQRLGL